MIDSNKVVVLSIVGGGIFGGIFPEFLGLPGTIPLADICIGGGAGFILSLLYEMWNI